MLIDVKSHIVSIYIQIHIGISIFLLFREPTSEADTAEESKSFECITSQRQNIESAIEITEPTAGCSKSNCQSNSVIQEENKTDNSKISKIIEQFKEIPEAPLLFNEKRGRNIELTCSGCRASRTSSYNQGVVISGRPLCRDTIFQVCEYLNFLNVYYIMYEIKVLFLFQNILHFRVSNKMC